MDTEAGEAGTSHLLENSTHRCRGRDIGMNKPNSDQLNKTTSEEEKLEAISLHIKTVTMEVNILLQNQLFNNDHIHLHKQYP